MAAFDEPKSWIAIFAGIFVTALGLIPLLEKWGALAFTWPEVILNLIDGIAIWLIAGIALLLFIDALWEDDTIRGVTIITSILLFLVGLMQILFNFGVIGFGLGAIPTIVYYILFVIEGLFLVIASFAMD